MFVCYDRTMKHFWHSYMLSAAGERYSASIWARIINLLHVCASSCWTDRINTLRSEIYLLFIRHSTQTHKTRSIMVSFALSAYMSSYIYILLVACRIRTRDMSVERPHKQKGEFVFMVRAARLCQKASAKPTGKCHYIYFPRWKSKLYLYSFPAQ